MKLFGFVRRRDDFSAAKFMSYWRDVHAPMGAGVAGIEGYVLSERLPAPVDREGTAIFDGIAEFWFADAAGRQAMRVSPQAPALFAATLNFVGRQKSFLAEEHQTSYPAAHTRFKSLLMLHGRSAGALDEAASAIA